MIRVCEDHRRLYGRDSDEMVELLSRDKDGKYRSGVLYVIDNIRLEFNT